MSDAARKLDEDEFETPDAGTEPNAPAQDLADDLFDAPAPELTDEEAADALLGPFAAAADGDVSDDPLDKALAEDALSGGLSPDDDPTEEQLLAAKKRAEEAAAAEAANGKTKKPKFKLASKRKLSLPKLRLPKLPKLPKLPRPSRRTMALGGLLSLGYIAVAAMWVWLLWPPPLDEHGLPPRLEELGEARSEILRGPRRALTGQDLSDPISADPEAASLRPEVGDDGVRLLPGPAEGLYEVTEAGLLLPKRGVNDGETPFIKYARPFTAPADTPIIAIIVTGLGRDLIEAESVIPALPRDITLSFVPYSDDLDRLVSWSRQQHGHEAVLSLPMEPLDYSRHDPGPDALLADAAPAENIDKLYRHLASTSGYVAVKQHMGGAMSTRADALRPILAELDRRGLAFLDAGTNPDSVSGNIASRLSLPHGTVQSKIDDHPQPRAIRDALQKLEAEARRSGTAIGVAETYRVTLDELRRWAPGLQRRGIRLAPLSAVMQRRLDETRPRPRFEP